MLQDLEIQRNILEDAKTFDDVEEQYQQATSPISLNNFPSDSAMNVEIDRSDMRNTEEPPAVQRHTDQIIETAEIDTNKHIVCEKQELEQKSDEAVPAATSPPLIESTNKTTEYESYKEETLNIGNKAITPARETPNDVVGRQSQTSTANVTNILQLQSNYYGPSVPRNNIVFSGVIQNSRDMRKVGV